MRLMYCVEDGFHDAKEFGLRMAGDDLQLEGAVLSRSPDKYRRVQDGKLTIEVFDGVIVDVDEDDDEVAFISVRDERGIEREFERVGGPLEYRAGRRMIVRYAETGRTQRGNAYFSVFEIWLV